MATRASARPPRPAPARRRSHEAEVAAIGGETPVVRVRRGRPDDGTAFMPDPEGGPAVIDDSLAESLAEEFVESATRGDDAVEEAFDQVVPEEIGGPFIETSAADEFAHDIDGANPVDAEVEALPKPNAGLVQAPNEEDDLA